MSDTASFEPPLAAAPMPLVPADCDLRDAPFMPLDVDRLLDSDVFGLEEPEAFRAAFASWAKSWRQMPAASLPDDDTLLCRLLGYGRAVSEWRRLREAGALHGWVKCSDGRLYHPVVAEKALALWLKRLIARRSGALGNATRYQYAFDDTEAVAAILDTADRLAALDPGSDALVRYGKYVEALRRDRGANDAGEGGDSTPTAPRAGSRSQGKAQGKGKAQSEEDISLSRDDGALRDGAPPACEPAPAREPDPAAGWDEDDPSPTEGEIIPPDPPIAVARSAGRRGSHASSADFDAWWEAYPKRVDKIGARKAYDRVVRDGHATAAELLAGAQRYAIERAGQDPKFTKGPERWLNAGCWADEPSQRGPPVRPGIGSRPGNRQDATMRAILDYSLND